MSSHKNTPVVIGISSLSQKDKLENLDEALILMDSAVKAAIKDTENNNITKYIDDIRIPKGYWKYRDPGKWIADKNNISNVKTSIAKVGVLQQNLINEACLNIINGNIKASLIIGGESRYKRVLASKAGKEYFETELNKNPDYYIKAKDELRIPEEEDELGQMAVGYYSIIDSAYRSRKGIKINEYKKDIADLYKKFSEVAVTNKESWLKKSISNEDILNESEKNKKQAFPYNKYHCTSWNVNQSVALIICSEEIADKLDVPNSKRVYPIASAESNHMIPTILRKDLARPMGMQLAAKHILNVCKDNNIKPNIYDLYSCFPIAVKLFADSLLLNKKDAFTVTGGMSFAGGPLNHYVLTSTVKVIEKIRDNNKCIGLVTGVSGMMTKQSYAVWSKNSLIPFNYKDVTEEAAKLDIPKKLSTKKSGEVKIVGYTIIGSGSEEKIIIYGEDTNGDRKVLVSNNKKYIKDMEINEWVGKKVSFKGKYLV